MHHEGRPGSSEAIIEKDDICAERPLEVDEGPVDTGGACSIPRGPRVNLHYLELLCLNIMLLSGFLHFSRFSFVYVIS